MIIFVVNPYESVHKLFYTKLDPTEQIVGIHLTQYALDILPGEMRSSGLG